MVKWHPMLRYTFSYVISVSWECLSCQTTQSVSNGIIILNLSPADFPFTLEGKIIHIQKHGNPVSIVSLHYHSEFLKIYFLILGIYKFINFSKSAPSSPIILNFPPTTDRVLNAEDRSHIYAHYPLHAYNGIRTKQSAGSRARTLSKLNVRRNFWKKPPRIFNNVL